MKLCIALALVVLAACSSSDDDDYMPPDVPEGTLDRLGDAGYQKLCNAFEDYIRDRYRSDRLLQAACTANALQTTTDAVACGAAVDECLDQLPPAVETQLMQILAQANCAAVDVQRAGCTSPVSALSTCLDALGSRVGQVQLALTCAAFGSPVPADWWKIEQPAECTALAAKC